MIYSIISTIFKYYFLIIFICFRIQVKYKLKLKYNINLILFAKIVNEFIYVMRLYIKFNNIL